MESLQLCGPLLLARTCLSLRGKINCLGKLSIRLPDYSATNHFRAMLTKRGLKLSAERSEPTKILCTSPNDLHETGFVRAPGTEGQGR